MQTRATFPYIAVLKHDEAVVSVPMPLTTASSWMADGPYVTWKAPTLKLLFSLNSWIALFGTST